jgi:glycosyltransferase involved in cell wall biosynthesis
VVTVHDLIFLHYPGDYNPVWRAITLALLPMVLRRARAIVTDSQTTRIDLMRFYRVPPHKITVIYPGIDHLHAPSRPESRFGAAPAGQAEQEREQGMQAALRYGIGYAYAPYPYPYTYILALGPLVRRKNIGVVVRAFGYIAAQLPDVHLVITGRTPAGMKHEMLAAELGRLPRAARSRVHLMGYVSRGELAQLLSRAAVLAYPSRFEGFGLPPLEAMAVGVPVVASDTPAVVESTGGAALIVSATSPQQWAEALTAVLTNRDQAQALVEAGRRRSARFTWDRCVRDTIALYKRLFPQSAIQPVEAANQTFYMKI